MKSSCSAARNRAEELTHLAPSDAAHLRLVADNMDYDDGRGGYIQLPGVDAERLRALALQLEAEDDDSELDALREHGNRVHRALCEAIEDLEAAGSESIAFVFIPADTPFAMPEMTMEQFSDLAVFLLDECE